MEQTKKSSKTKDIIIVISFILISLLGYLYINQIGINNDNTVRSTNLIKAINDSLTTYVNENNELTFEKRTLQGELSAFNDIWDNLSKSQQTLLNKVKQLEKDNKVIAAALIQVVVTLDSLKTNGKVTIDSNSITFEHKEDNIRFNARITNVRPINMGIKPDMYLTGLEIPNVQTVSFQWKENKEGKKEGYPVSFIVSNSNPLFSAKGVESYVIPEIEMQKIKPTLGKKILNFSKTTGGKITVFLGGAALGAVLAK